MKWTYKGVEITIENDGFFHFKLNGEDLVRQRLVDAQEIIDYKTDSYFRFKNKDLDTLLSKLDQREKCFVIDALTELENHTDNNYCELDVNTDFIYDFDINNFIYNVRF